MIPQERASDKGLVYILALRVSQLWDFVDGRQIDVYAVSVAVLYGSFKILFWSLDYATHAERPGLEVAAIITAIGGPWSLLQAAAIKFIFDARARSFVADAPGTTTSLKTTEKTTESKTT